MSDATSDLAPAGFADVLPDSMFRGLEPSAREKWQPSKFHPWYDAIIDDMLLHPGTTFKDVAIRLGRSPVAVGLICSSDLFKARYEARRASFNREVNERLVSRMSALAEKALDKAIDHLDTKPTSLPLLNDIMKSTLDRLGYAPSQQATSSVVINNNPTAVGQAHVSSAALIKSRGYMQQLQKLSSEPVVGIEVPVADSEVGGG
jgi:hypothetical protein